jgi:hypothetical protein
MNDERGVLQKHFLHTFYTHAFSHGVWPIPHESHLMWEGGCVKGM